MAFANFSCSKVSSVQHLRGHTEALQFVRKKSLVPEMFYDNRRTAVKHRRMSRTCAAVMNNRGTKRENILMRHFPDLVYLRMVGKFRKLVPTGLNNGPASGKQCALNQEFS